MSRNKRLDPVKPHIRWMIRRAMPEVMAIEDLCFPIPWSEEDFLRCLRNRNCIGMVSEVGEIVVGFMVYNLKKHWIEIVNFAVHPKWQRRKVGKAMADRMAPKLSSHRRRQIILEVRETNVDAQLFSRSQGYRAVGVRRGFYEDTTEDAYTFRYDLESEWEPVKRFATMEEP